MSRGWSSSADRVMAAASEKALDTLLHLGIDLSQPIDIFTIIEQSQIWLMFQPAPRLYGAYLPVGSTVGIIINAHHPLGLQRFTAAHEFAHHVLGHGPVIDDEPRVIPGHRLTATGALQERAAQAFAANFLMPLELVNTAMRRMDLPLRPEDMSALDVYQLALEVGVSYAAIVAQLQTLHKITAATAARLRRVPPQRIKEEIGGGTRPLNPWADTWPAGPKDAGHLLRPRVDDEIHIRLPETPSTGYVWTLPEDRVADHRNGSESEPAAQPYLLLVADTFTPTAAPGSGVIGAGGWRHLVLRVARPGRFSLQLAKRRRWQRSAPPVEVFSVELDALARRTGEYDRGLSEQQKSLLSLAA